MDWEKVRLYYEDEDEEYDDWDEEETEENESWEEEEEEY